MAEPSLTPRWVGAVILSPSEQGPRVVLTRRARAPLAGQWSLPGGRLEFGETLVQGVAREALEETGLVVQVGRLVEVFELITAEHHYVIHEYRCSVEGGTLRAGDDAAEAVWAPVIELSEYGVTPDVLRVVAKAVSAERD